MEDGCSSATRWCACDGARTVANAVRVLGLRPRHPSRRVRTSSRFVEGVGSDGGYAYIGVNLRGTGCSDGTFDFFQPQEGRDGASVIEWIIQQPWSNGRVGMIGKSYPGITQLFVAEEQPPGLVAITPGHFFGDAYRDVARPGGIMNKGFATLWSFIGRPSYEVQDGPGEIARRRPAVHQRRHRRVPRSAKNPFVQLLQHPWDDAAGAASDRRARTSTASACRCSPCSPGRTSSSRPARAICCGTSTT